SAHLHLQLARYHPAIRAGAVVYWQRFCPAETRALWDAKLSGFSERNKHFPGDPIQASYIAALQAQIAEFAERTRLYPAAIAQPAGEYLFHEIVGDESFVASKEAHRFAGEFRMHLAAK